MSYRADTLKSNKPKNPSTWIMRKLLQWHKLKLSEEASIPKVAIISRALQAMNIETDSKQTTQSKEESEEKRRNTNQRGSTSTHDCSEVLYAHLLDILHIIINELPINFFVIYCYDQMRKIVIQKKNSSETSMQ